MTRAAAVVSLLCATLSACEPAPEPRPASPPVATPVAQSRFHAARPISDLQNPEAIDSIERMKARSVGIVYSTSSTGVPNNIAVLNDTAHEVQTIAQLRFFRTPDGGWSDTLFVRDPRLFAVGLVRATHDDYGFPVLVRKGDWARAIFAFDTTGTPQAGWVRIESGQTLYQSEDSALLSYSTHFGGDIPRDFFDRPDGARVTVPTKPSAMVQVLETRPEWLRVAVTVPDTASCAGDPSLKVTFHDTVWIRRYGPDGRRQVTAAVAGC